MTLWKSSIAYALINYSFIHYIMYNNNNNMLTGWSTVTAPSILKIWGCLNCPMMAPSWRNLAWSSSLDPSFNILIATSKGPYGVLQVPLHTWPNAPDPRRSSVLQWRGKGWTNKTMYACMHMYALGERKESWWWWWWGGITIHNYGMYVRTYVYNFLTNLYGPKHAITAMNKMVWKHTRNLF